MISLLLVGMLALAIAVVISIVLYLNARDRKRREGLERASLEIGFVYSRVADVELPDLELFNMGRSIRKKNLLTATRNEIAWSVFDYEFSTGKHVQMQTVVMAQLDRELPEFSLSREHFYHRLGELIGFKDIDFEYYPEFSRKYYLRGKDEEAVRELFTSHVISTIMSQELKSNVEGKGNFIIVYTPNVLVNPAHMYEFLQKVMVIINLFK